jgi:hypothetical protein
VAADFRVQRYQDRPVLTWWQGRLFVGDGVGEGVIYDASYKQIASIKAGNRYTLDLHEVLITPQDTALVMSYERVRRDLEPLGGPRDGLAVDNVLQEIDIKTGLVLFEWHSIDHIDLSESHAPVPKASGGEWDYFHINSAAVDRDGNFVISARNSWGVYKIERSTGKVLWRLGGKKSSFEMGPGTSTSWQHSARPQPDGTIMLFDNGAAPATRKRSRAITVRLDTQAETATLVSTLTHPRDLLSATQGSVEPLSNGNTFVGYGSQRWFSEYTPTGELVFDGRIARGNDNYRAFRSPWTGTPAQPPRLVAIREQGRVTARASWNGATGVARWQLLAGPDAKSLSEIAAAPRAGFETAVTAATTENVVAMRALDARGETLATTEPAQPAEG